MAEIKLPDFDEHIPALYAGRLNFRKDRWLMMQAGLFALARTGFSTAGELQDLLSGRFQLEADSYALQRIFREYLPAAGLTEYSVLPFFRFGLACTRLTPLGEAICQEMGWQVRASEWGTLIMQTTVRTSPNTPL